jgi:hypothetical protein
MKRGPQRLHGTIFVLARAVDNAPDGCSVTENRSWEQDIVGFSRYRVSDQGGLTARFKTSPIEQVREDLGLFNGIIESVMCVLALRTQE